MVIRSASAPSSARRSDDPFMRDLGDPEQIRIGKARVVRRVAIAGDPHAIKIPKFSCGKSRRRSVFLSLDAELILALGRFLEDEPIKAKGATFKNTKDDLARLLKAFNESDEARAAREELEDIESAQLALSPDPCSMPNHVWTGHGCKPAASADSRSSVGHLFSLTIGDPPSTLFGKVYNGPATFAYGYCVGVEFKFV